MQLFRSKEWSASDKKVSKARTLFNGPAQQYRNWADRMKDHCKEVNCEYAEIFRLIEASKPKITNANLTIGKLSDGTDVDFKWVSQHLWVFIAKHINDDLHGRRLALTQNDPDNGFKLWRALSIENEGGRASGTRWDVKSPLFSPVPSIGGPPALVGPVANDPTEVRCRLT